MKTGFVQAGFFLLLVVFGWLSFFIIIATGFSGDFHIGVFLFTGMLSRIWTSTYLSIPLCFHLEKRKVFRFHDGNTLIKVLEGLLYSEKIFENDQVLFNRSLIWRERSRDGLPNNSSF